MDDDSDEDYVPSDIEEEEPPYKVQRREPPPDNPKHSESENEYLRSMDIDQQWELYDKEMEIYEDTIEASSIPRRFRFIANDGMPFIAKQVVLQTLDKFKPNSGNSEQQKRKQWLQKVEMIPFGQYAELPIDTNNPNEVSDFLTCAKNSLDNEIYGHNEGKSQILKLFSQWIANPNDQRGTVIGIQGNPGVGKTTLVKDGICKLFNLPNTFISLGGISDSCNLVGHSYTYVNSKNGSIVQGLIEMQAMNGVFFMDELDKISNTSHGEEIINTLICLTDPAQNISFHDHYFNEIPIDLSRCVFVFTFNEEEKISNILLNRMTIIRASDYGITDKIQIGKDYLLPRVEKKYNVSIYPSSETFEEDVRTIVVSYIPSEPGVRTLHRALEHCISEELTERLFNHGHVGEKHSVQLQPQRLAQWASTNMKSIETSHLYI